MTAIVQITYKVGKFDACKVRFASHLLGRKKPGVSSYYRVPRSMDDPYNVTIDLDFADSNQAKTLESALEGICGKPPKLKD